MNKVKKILNELIRRGWWFNNTVFPDCRKFWTHNQYNLDVINLGSNSGKFAFSYQDIPLRCANWAMGPQSLSADFQILRNYFSFLKPENATVIIPICPFSSLGGYAETFDDRYYSILSLSSIPHGSVRQKNKIFAIKNNPLQYFPLMALKNELVHRLKKTKSCTMSESSMEADANRWIQGWMKEFSLYDLEYPLDLVNQDRYDLSVSVLTSIIDFCKERNIKIALVIPPVTNILLSRFTTKAREILIESFIRSANIQDVPYLNYMDNLEFSNDLSLFRNSFFLNERGAKKLTKRVLSDLKLI